MRACLFAAVVALCLPAAGAAQAVPTGFQDEVVAGPFFSGTGLAFLPDGRFFVLHRGGTFSVVLPAGTHDTVATLPGVTLTGERGAMSVEVDPAWPVWPYLYFHYTHNSPDVRIVRMTLAGDLSDPTSTNLSVSALDEVLVGVPDQHPFHNGGKLRFGTDNMLYASFGEDQAPCDAQDENVLSGSVLRLDVSTLHGVTGGGPPSHATIAAPGNPFTGPDAQLVWATGLRNPYSYDIDPVTGNLYVADVGGSGWEEINEISGPGLDFGWPHREGAGAHPTSCPGAAGPFEDPIVAVPHAMPVPQAIISFGGRYRAQAGAPHGFGAAYDGDVFYTDFFSGEVRRLSFDGSTWSAASPVPGQPAPDIWAVLHGKVTEARLGPDGAVYYLSTVPTLSGTRVMLRRLRPGASGGGITAAAGDGQVGTAGWPLPQPLVVEVTDASGVPQPGVPVSFQVTTGAGNLGQESVMTDGAGRAQTGFVPGTGSIVDPVVTASAPGFGSVDFSVVWRGLKMVSIPSASLLTAVVKNSAAGTPLTLVADAPPAAPYFLLDVGAVWTRVTGPQPPWFFLDGLGLLGPGNPSLVTGQDRTWSLVEENLPAFGGLQLVVQAYAVDSALLPFPEGVLVSNPVFLTLP